MISPSAFKNDIFDRNDGLGRDAMEVMAAAINAVDPAFCVQGFLQSSSQTITIGQSVINTVDLDRIILIGFGKASVPMAVAGLDILGDRCQMATVVTKDLAALSANGYQGKLEVHLGGHPIPNESSILSTREILQSLPDFSCRDLVVVMISGGGSALFTDPVDSVSLEDIQEMTDLFLRSGATIQEINTIRKHLDRVKGGRLAGLLAPAKVHTLILSDVIGDPLDMIASGPTIPDPTTYPDALNVIQKYGLTEKLPPAIISYISGGILGENPETLKDADFSRLSVDNHLIGTNIQAALAAKNQAQELGYHSLILTTHLTGLTEDIARFLSAVIQTERDYQQPLEPPYCLILGGETTVKVTGDGLGGRNQDLALRMTRTLANYPDTLFISLATDGEDGPTDAAGAVADGLLFQDARDRLGLDIEQFIQNQNSYRYFSKSDGLIKIGSTGTNVNDLIFIFCGMPEGG